MGFIRGQANAWLFVALSALDLALTWAIIHCVEGDCSCELNPVARAVLESAGWFGLTLFKAAGVVIVEGICAYIKSQGRPATARWTLAVCNLLMLGVAAYNCSVLASLLQP
jgi:hypothetical protein